MKSTLNRANVAARLAKGQRPKRIGNTYRVQFPDGKVASLYVLIDAAPMAGIHDDHDSDEQCLLDWADVCVFCGVYHGDPCHLCGGRGFHSPYCNDCDAPADPGSITVENHGSIMLLRADAPAYDWLVAHVSEDAQWFGGALVCEPRYVKDLVQGASDAGIRIARGF